MEEIVKIPDDIFIQATDGTPLKSKINFIIMSLLCRIDNCSYTPRALYRELSKKIPGIEKKTISLGISVLLNEDYIGTKGRIIKNIYAKDRGKETLKETYAKLLELTGHSEKTPKLRKSFYQEYHERPQYACIDPWSLVNELTYPTESL